MNIVFMGTPDFSVGGLEALIEAGHHLQAVVTQPDKKRGRGEKVSFSPVKEAALQHGIPVFQPQKVREEDFIRQLQGLAPDVIVVIAFGQLLPKEILRLAPYGCINVHASLLPKYRGAAPIQWAVMDGEQTTGVTIMQMDEGLDTGDILKTVEVPIHRTETGGSLFDKLSVAGAKLLVKALQEMEQGSLKPVKQDDSRSNYAKMLKKEFGNLNFDRPAKELECWIRGLNPWPSAYTHLEGKTLKLWEAEVLEEEYEGENGQIVAADKTGFVIKTGKGSLRIRELQLEGKKRMKTEQFLLGYKAEQGLVGKVLSRE